MRMDMGVARSNFGFGFVGSAKQGNGTKGRVIRQPQETTCVLTIRYNSLIFERDETRWKMEHGNPQRVLTYS